MKRVLLSLVVTGAIFVVATPRASAHVLITDSKTDSSAVLHIQPDDDPEAGKVAEFYYELQTKVNPTTFSEYRLYITDEKGQTTQLGTTTTDHSLASRYTFPSQGLYVLELKSTNPWKYSFDLRYSLRVSRGTAGGAAMRQQFAWTQPVLIATTVAFILLSVLFANNRTSILNTSRFR